MKEIPLTQGKVALVDDSDFEWLNQWKWCAHNDHGWGWYAVRRSPRDSNGKWGIIRMHRLIVGAQPGQQVDHRNREGLDNQRHNLRLCNDSQNQANARKRAGCSSQFKGVSWDKQYSKWLAQITINYKSIHLGRFDDEVEAALTYNKAATEHFGEFARLNLVE